MTGRYLVELGDVLRAAGLAVVEYDGWKTRARSSGGYSDGRPWAIVWHHTASDTKIESDAAYCATGDEDAPVCNALFARDGAIWLIAAGASNCNGKGGPWAVSRGTVPPDQMNTHAVSWEICNAGTGQPYPPAQLDAVFAATAAVSSWLGLDAVDSLEHVEWAPDRKIDPATVGALPGPWYPRSLNSSGSWNGDDLRAEIARRAGDPAPFPPQPGPPVPIPIDEEDMLVCALDSNGTAWIGNGITRFALDDPAAFDRYVLVWKGRFMNTSGGAVRGWGDVQAVDDYVIEALGRP